MKREGHIQKLIAVFLLLSSAVACVGTQYDEDDAIWPEGKGIAESTALDIMPPFTTVRLTDLGENIYGFIYLSEDHKSLTMKTVDFGNRWAGAQILGQDVLSMDLMQDNHVAEGGFVRNLQVTDIDADGNDELVLFIEGRSADALIKTRKTFVPFYAFDTEEGRLELTFEGYAHIEEDNLDKRYISSEFYHEGGFIFPGEGRVNFVGVNVEDRGFLKDNVYISGFYVSDRISQEQGEGYSNLLFQPSQALTFTMDDDGRWASFTYGKLDGEEVVYLLHNPANDIFWQQSYATKKYYSEIFVMKRIGGEFRITGRVDYHFVDYGLNDNPGFYSLDPKKVMGRGISYLGDINLDGKHELAFSLVGGEVFMNEFDEPWVSYYTDRGIDIITVDSVTPIDPDEIEEYVYVPDSGVLQVSDLA